MTNEVITAFLQIFSKTFAEGGFFLKTRIRPVTEHLYEVNQLPLEVPTYVLQGMNKCSVPEFTGTFDMILNQERVNQMDTPVLLVNTLSNSLNHVLNILHLVNNYYHYLNTSNDWNVPQGKRGHYADQDPRNTPIFPTVTSPICSQVVSVLAMKQISRATVKFIWISALTSLLLMEGTISGPKVVVVMSLIGSMYMGLN